MASWRLARLSSNYRGQAVLHARLEQVDLQMEQYCRTVLETSNPAYLRRYGDEMRARREAAATSRQYQRMLKEKYLRAASMPWCPVAEDPPEPPPIDNGT